MAEDDGAEQRQKKKNPGCALPDAVREGGRGGESEKRAMLATRQRTGFNH